MKTSVIRIIGFIIVFTLVLTSVNSVLKFKYGDGIYSLKKFYEQKNDSVDVLVLGSSHGFADFNTGILWDKYGIAAYDLCGAQQPLWNTYYYFKEALKTQTPELVILEGYMVTNEDEYIHYGSLIKNTFGMKLSNDKLDAIKVSSPKEMWLDCFMGYTQYHNRYSELGRADFLKDQGNKQYTDWKGFTSAVYMDPQETVDVSDITDTMDLYGKSEDYYRKILELAKTKEIPLLVVISPYPGITPDEQRKFNRAEQIAKEYGALFLNYNPIYRDTGMDYSTDYSDEGHMNYRGSITFSDNVGSYLADNYTLPDRRNDQSYDSWERNARYCEEKLREQKIRYSAGVDELLDNISVKNNAFIISADHMNEENKDILEKILRKLGGDGSGEQSGGVWYLDEGINVWYSGSGNNEYCGRIDGHDLDLKRYESGSGEEYLNDVYIDDKAYAGTLNEGINIVIYNKITGTVILNTGITEDGELSSGKGE